MATKKQETQQIVVKGPKLESARFRIIGTSPYVQHKFSQKAREQMRKTQEGGQSSRSKRGGREPKDFQQSYEQAMHVASEGWAGIPAPAFRNAMISACRLVGFKMTVAKLSVFVEPDGFDVDDGTPLVRISKGEPHAAEHMVRLATGVADVRWRPMWQPGWEAIVTVWYDTDQFTQADVANLMLRVGMQVGIGEGRPDSKNSAGMGWGTFRLATE